MTFRGHASRIALLVIIFGFLHLAAPFAQAGGSHESDHSSSLSSENPAKQQAAPEEAETAESHSSTASEGHGEAHGKHESKHETATISPEDTGTNRWLPAANITAALAMVGFLALRGRRNLNAARKRSETEDV